MIVDALVPVKAAAVGKERLAGLLTADVRAGLVRAMLHDVVAALAAVSGIRRVAVTSPDTEMLAFAAELGATPLAEPPGTRGLNAALSAAIARLADGGADAVLVVQGDVPEIAPDEVAALLAWDSPPPARRMVRAAPSADGGTSALLLIPPGVISPAFGEDSFARHRAAARSAGITFEPHQLPSLARDVDRPVDVRRLLRGGRASRTVALLRAAQADARPISCS